MDDHLSGLDFGDYGVSKIIEKIYFDTKNWVFNDDAGCPWFRGQSLSNGPIPSIFRNKYDEFNMNTMFRNRASVFSEAPETDRLDKWLFLAQHYGLPTRLLDWTENPLHALYFALKDCVHKCKSGQVNDQPSQPTLWALHPYALNEESNIRTGFPNTWTQENIGSQYFRFAFHPKQEWITRIDPCLCKYKFPIAISTNYFSRRIFLQRSCFTIHGIDERDFVSLFKERSLISNKYLYKYVIPIEIISSLFKELRLLGVGESSIFPDLMGLADELRIRFEQSK